MTTRYSNKLKQNITIKNDGSVLCDDGTHYSKKEMSLIKGSGDDEIKLIHGIKKIFLGEVVK